jgi:hypothetical protein
MTPAEYRGDGGTPWRELNRGDLCAGGGEPLYDALSNCCFGDSWIDTWNPYETLEDLHEKLTGDRRAHT